MPKPEEKLTEAEVATRFECILRACVTTPPDRRKKAKRRKAKPKK